MRKLYSFNACLLLILVANCLSAQWVQMCPALARPGSFGGMYEGNAIAYSADGNTAALSYRFDSAGQAGGVFIFRKTGNQWTQQARLKINWTPGTLNVSDGMALSGDGNVLALSNVGITSLIYPPLDTLEVYEFSNGTWNKRADIKTGRSNTALQAYQVAISYNGNRIVRGGKVYVRSGATWVLETVLRPNDRPIPGNPGYCDTANTFSCSSSSSISADGNTIAVGDLYYADTTTNAWIFTYNGTAWVQQGSRLEGVGNTGHQYQNAQPGPVIISGDGNTLAIGTTNALDGDKVWVFKRTGNVWAEQTTPGHMSNTGYGRSSHNISISYDGNVILKAIGRGVSFYCWRRTGSAWSTDNRVFKASSTDAYENIYTSYMTSGNTSLLIDSSGTQVFAANPDFELGVGAGWYFTASADSFIQTTPKIFGTGVVGAPSTGAAIAISADGSTMAIGAASDNGGEGAVWMYKRNASSWQLLGPKIVLSNTPVGHGFGGAVSLSADGSVLAVGAPYSHPNYFYYDGPGNTYVFTRSGNTYVQLGDSITRTSTGYNFGYKVALSQDGTTLLASTIDSGFAIFTRTGNNWQQQGNFTVPVNYLDGVALSGDGNTAAITAQADDNYKGNIYVCTRTGNTWGQQGLPLRPSSAQQFSYFPSGGISLSYNGNALAAGHSNLFVFHRSGNTWAYPDSINHGTYFGNTVISDYGDSVATAAPGASVSPGVFVFSNNGSQWSLTPSLINSDHPITYSPLAGSGNLNYISYAYTANAFTTDIRIYKLMPMVDSLALLQAATCNQTANGKITVTVHGGSGPYNFVWSNGLPNSGVQTGLLPGTYNLTLTDASGDTVTRQYVVGVSHTATASVGDSTSWNCGTNTGSATININGGTGPFTYTWGTQPVLHTATAPNLIAGSYAYTVTDSFGCIYTDTAHIQALVYSVVAGNTGAPCGQNGTATAAMYGTAPYVYVWSTTQTTASISAPVGSYTVTVIDANNCSASASTIITAYCDNYVTGRVFFDRNADCVQGGQEPGVNYLTMIADNGAGVLYGSTNASGDYSITVPDSGNYTVSINHWQQCAYPVCASATYPVAVTVHGPGDTLTNVNFPLVNAGIDLTLQTFANAALPGANFDYFVYYGNLQDSVLPTGTLTLVYDSNITLTNSVPLYSNLDAVNHVVTFNLQQIGLLYGYGQHVMLTFNVPGAVLPRTALLMTSTISPTATDCNPTNNTIAIPVYVGGSLDPNYKVAYPANTIPITDSVLTYTIHFQNVGNAPTQFVEIRDTLGPYVDPASVVTVSASHKPYTFNISGSGILSWMFNPLALPDSATDPAGSQGYVTFTVKTKPGLALGTAIQNTASIYFDYNAAVVTNTVTNVVNNPLGITTISNHSFAMQLYPNPANSLVNVEVPALAIGGQLQITDVTGRLIAQQSINTTLLQLNTSAMASGMYFVKAITSSGQSAVCKLVIEK